MVWIRERDNAVGHANAILIKDGPKVVGRMPRELADFISPCFDEEQCEPLTEEDMAAVCVGKIRNDDKKGSMLECVYLFRFDDVEQADNFVTDLNYCCAEGMNSLV